MKRKPYSKWNIRHAIPVAILTYTGASDDEIVRHLGVSHSGYKKWKTKKFLLHAISTAKAMRKERKRDTFQQYIVSRLSAKAKQVWDQIMFHQESENAHERIQEIMSGQTKEMNQRLWLYAFMSHKFTKSAACKATGISMATVRTWMETKEFRDLFLEVEDLKKDFFEEQLVRLAEAGDNATIIFANRTLNRDRGYGDKVEVSHTGNVGVQVEHTYNIENLLPMISVGARLELKEAMKRLEAPADNKKEAIEIQTEEVEDET